MIHTMRFINWFKSLFQEKKPFKLGGEKTLEINEKTDGSTSTITYRMPNGDEMLQYVHAQLQDDKSELRKLSTENLSSYELHNSIRIRKFIPFAKKIITKIDGYVDENGKETNDIELVEKYKPGHLELVCSVAYVQDETFKKKD